MDGYATFPRTGAVERVSLVSRPVRWRKVAVAAMVLLSATAVLTATRSPVVDGSLRGAVDVVSIRDDPTFDPRRNSESHEPHHKGDAPATVYFHNDKAHGHDDDQYIASLAEQGAEIEDVQHGATMAHVDDEAKVVEHREKQDKRETFHKATLPAKDSPQFKDNANIMDVLSQYEKQVESASTHLEKLDHAEQTEAASTKGDAQAVQKIQDTVGGEIKELHTEMDDLKGQLTGMEQKLDHNDDVMSKLETVMEDVYYQENDDHTRLQTISHTHVQQDLKAKYKPPSPWATNNEDDIQPSEQEDDYYYVADPK